MRQRIGPHLERPQPPPPTHEKPPVPRTAFASQPHPFMRIGNHRLPRMGTQPSQNGDGIRVDSQHGRRPSRNRPRMGRAPRLAAPRQPGRIHALRQGRQPQITHASKPTRKQAGARRLREGKHDVRTDEREATPTHEGGRQVAHGSGPDDTRQPTLREAQGRRGPVHGRLGVVGITRRHGIVEHDGGRGMPRMQDP